MNQKYNMDTLKGLSSEQYIKIILDLQQRIEELEALINNPKKNSKNSSQPPSTDRKPSSTETKNKGGAKKGHKAHFRKKITEPDKIITMDIDRCPNCGMRHGSKSNTYTTHQIIEIKSFEFEIIDIKRQKSTCGYGSQSILAPNPPGVLDNSLFGPNLTILILIMYYVNHVSIRNIHSFIEDFSTIKICRSSITNVLHRCGKVFKNNYDEIVKNVKNGKIVGIDETGWRVCDSNYWMWVFQNEENTIFKIENSRSSKVVKEVLGNDYNGILVSDFFSVYGDITQSHQKQKCLAHLIRELNYIYELTGKQDASYSDRLIKLFQTAIKLKNEVQFGSDDFIKHRLDIEKELDALINEEVIHKDEKRIKKRLSKYRTELLVFLYEEKVPATNNLREQALRSNVIHRKSCYGNKSLKGKQSYEVISSLICSMKKRKENIYRGLKRLFEKKNEIIPKYDILKRISDLFNTS